MANNLRICTFNCRSVKSSIGEIHKLCESHDIVFLQEHWLLPFELELLSSIHSDFFGFGTSAVDINVDLLIGRPYGGTGVLYRKHLASNITILTTDECRITSLIFKSAVGPVLFVNVYMPTDYDSYDNWSDIL
jgi:exonuclease III